MPIDNTTATGARERLAPEIVFGLVSPIGANSELVCEELARALSEVGYRSTPRHLIEFVPVAAQQRNVHQRYEARMDAGDQLRKDLDRADAFALLAAALIVKQRADTRPDREWHQRDMAEHAFILRSLKRPEEVDTLRAIYGDAFFLVAVHASREARVTRLAWDIVRSDYGGSSGGTGRPQAEALVERDERDVGKVFGQQVSNTFPLADAFIDGSHPAAIAKSVDRLIEILFGYPFHTPTRGEYAMFHAQGAALRSADLSRQVGTVITSPSDEIVALGCNEVPRAGGGLYWEGDEPDYRDFRYGHDASTEMKRKALGQIVRRLAEGGWLVGDKAQAIKAQDQNTQALLDEAWRIATGTELLNVLEFGRSVHAELAALMDAGRRGISVAGCTLYTTTFPCHVCARHIIASGIRRVVYNEPYPKSLARYLHLDSIAVDTLAASAEQIPFDPFVGVSPRRYIDLFRAPSVGFRKTHAGEIARWDRKTASPRLSGSPVLYLRREMEAMQELAKATEEKGVNLLVGREAGHA